MDEIDFKYSIKEGSKKAFTQYFEGKLRGLMLSVSASGERAFKESQKLVPVGLPEKAKKDDRGNKVPVGDLKRSGKIRHYKGQNVDKVYGYTLEYSSTHPAIASQTYNYAKIQHDNERYSHHDGQTAYFISIPLEEEKDYIKDKWRGKI